VVEAGIRGFLMLADAMRGPNHENQASIAHTGLIDLGDRIFGKIHFEDLNGKTKARNRHRNRHGEDRRKEKAIWRNRVRSRLKSAVASCLLTFLEGVESDDIPNMMLTTVQWTLIGAQMACCHRDLARAAEVLDYPMLFEEGMTYYFILRTLYP
jgi:DNA-binding protein Fis